MNATRWLALSTTLLLLVGCAGQSHRHDRPQNDNPIAPTESEMRQASLEWDALFNTQDAAKVASLYAEDAISMPPNLPTLLGRPAIQADFQAFFADNFARHETFIDRIVHDGDLTIETAHYRLTYKPRAGGTEIVESGRHVECRRKLEGKWKIVVEIWNSETPIARPIASPQSTPQSSPPSTPASK